MTVNHGFHELYAPLITAVSPHKIKKMPPPIFVDHDKNFLDVLSIFAWQRLI